MEESYGELDFDNFRIVEWTFGSIFGVVLDVASIALSIIEAIEESANNFYYFEFGFLIG